MAQYALDVTEITYMRLEHSANVAINNLETRWNVLRNELIKFEMPNDDDRTFLKKKLVKCNLVDRYIDLLELKKAVYGYCEFDRLYLLRLYHMYYKFISPMIFIWKKYC